ncbi:MAG: hypothetical protein EOP61_32210 [Sphingomonadales bacterium]|nr:MAG: hypothetical protein EOP61_32210 [Sphingomonadales bacterium]
MKFAAQFLILCLALFATTAHARGIDCAKAARKLDAAICGDPELLDYDKRIAAAYDNAVAIWSGAIAPYVRREQQEWLTVFRTIETVQATEETLCEVEDISCIRVEMRRRVVDIESGAYVHSGVYRAANGMKLLLHPRYANDYRVRVYDPARAAKVNVVTAEGDRTALWDGTQFMVSTMGDANGLPLPPEDGCTLRLLPQPLSIQVFQKGACQGQSYEGTYNRLLDETLRSYELELH